MIFIIGLLIVVTVLHQNEKGYNYIQNNKNDGKVLVVCFCIIFTFLAIYGLISLTVSTVFIVNKITQTKNPSPTFPSAADTPASPSPTPIATENPSPTLPSAADTPASASPTPTVSVISKESPSPTSSTSSTLRPYEGEGKLWLDLKPGVSLTIENVSYLENYFIPLVKVNLLIKNETKNEIPGVNLKFYVYFDTFQCCYPYDGNNEFTIPDTPSLRKSVRFACHEELDPNARKIIVEIKEITIDGNDSKIPGFFKEVPLSRKNSRGSQE
ncbi:MAG: hypothetical protein VKL59_15180 [Nostocaceae cyanobacterium]|nr:hypothetical protein [Nostocaceae cyanobacterium]